MRGRKPKPEFLRLLDGNAGRRPDPGKAAGLASVEPSGDLNEPPADLKPEEVAIWNEAIRNAPPGLLKRLDASIFKIWVVEFNRFNRANAEVHRLGEMVKSKEGAPYQNPYLGISRRAAMEMRRAAAELGFTPSARTRVKIAKPDKSANPFGDLKSLDD